MSDHRSRPPICFLISSYRPIIGGAERATESVARHLVGNGAEVLVLTRHHRSLPRREEIGGVTVCRLGVDGPRLLSSAAFVIHALALLALRLRRFPFVHVQNIDSPLLIGILAKALLGKKLVVTIHGEKNIAFRKQSALGRWRVRQMAKAGDRFVAITENCRRQYLEEGIAADRIASIPNGIDTALYQPAQTPQKEALKHQFGLSADDHVVLFVGRLVGLKRVDVLIRAIAVLQERSRAHCVIVGDGPERAKLKALVASERTVDRVHLVGPTNDVLPYYQMADIFVLPSLYEGLSVALLEAMACGLCPVVAGSPGNLVLVKHHVNGLVFPVDTPEALQERLREALADPSLPRSLGRAARDVVQDVYSIENVVKAHSALYADLMRHG